MCVCAFYIYINKYVYIYIVSGILLALGSPSFDWKPSYQTDCQIRCGARAPAAQPAEKMRKTVSQRMQRPMRFNAVMADACWFDVAVERLRCHWPNSFLPILLEPKTAKWCWSWQSHSAIHRIIPIRKCFLTIHSDGISWGNHGNTWYYHISTKDHEYNHIITILAYYKHYKHMITIFPWLFSQIFMEKVKPLGSGGVFRGLLQCGLQLFELGLGSAEGETFPKGVERWNGVGKMAFSILEMFFWFGHVRVYIW